jgi:hypothetical protein
LILVKGRPARAPPNERSIRQAPMTSFQTLVAQWECFDEAAFQAEWRLERQLDAYCVGGDAPPAAEIAAAKRLRFVARHRLRWLLFQTRSARARVASI